MQARAVIDFPVNFFNEAGRPHKDKPASPRSSAELCDTPFGRYHQWALREIRALPPGEYLKTRLHSRTFSIADPRHDPFPGERLEESGDVELIATNRRIDVGRHPAHPACDDRDPADHHPGDRGGVQRSGQIGERRLELTVTAAARFSHVAGSAPNGGAPGEQPLR